MFQNIVAGTDGSSRGRQVVTVAAGLASAHGARLHLVWAHRMASSISSAAAASVDLMSTALVADRAVGEEVAAGLDLLRVELERAGIEVHTYPVTGGAAECILDVAGHQSADLIVVGNKGMRGARRVLGSTPNTIAHQAACAVLIVPTDA